MLSAGRCDHPIEWEGLVTGVAPGLAKSRDSLCNLKSCNALIYVLAAEYGRQCGWDDTLLQNTDERIIESTIANIFWGERGSIYTPPLSEGCIAGVMRRHLIERLSQHFMHVKEIPLTVDELHEATEVWLTNAIRKIKWIKSIDNKNYECQLVREADRLLTCF